ncbi:MAG: type 4a pilus biogenesis protein PilO [Gammaproteobacteria bacterium]|nr:type 4a pilus biogenesis protein PilO [Gammaproteobacteria bacterium]
MDLQELTEKINSFDVNDIDWNNMGSWPLAGRVFFATLVFVSVLVGLYFFDIQSLVERNEQVVAKEETLKQDFETKAFRVANLAAYKKQLADIEESFGSLLRQLPRDTEVAGLLEDITDSALGANLDIRSIKLDKEKETQFYTELPINIDVVGEYHDFGAFVSAVAGLGRIVTLHDFSVAPLDKAASKKLNLKIVAKTYRYNDEQKPSKKKKKKKKAKG